MRNKLNLLLLIMILTAVLFAGCGGNGKNETSGDKNYTITVTVSDDYTLVPSSTSAKQGTTISVTASSLSADKVITSVKFNDNNCTEADGGYSFIMPAENVTLTATVETVTEVKEDGIAQFDANNITTVPKKAVYNGLNFNDKRWGLDITFIDAAYMAYVDYEIFSSNENAVPVSAISVKSYSKADLGIGGINDFEIVKAKVLIDTEKIEVGSTWLTMDFQSVNVTSDKGRLVIKINVCEYGALEVETFKETLQLDVGSVGADDAEYTVRVCDKNHIDGSVISSASKDFTLTATNGIISIQIDYVVGHEYWVRVTAGNEDDYNTTLTISEEVSSGASYTGDVDGLAGTGVLTFSEKDSTITLKVNG